MIPLQSQAATRVVAQHAGRTNSLFSLMMSQAVLSPHGCLSRLCWQLSTHAYNQAHS